MTPEPDTAFPSADLLMRGAQGDGSAFRELVERHQQYAYSLAFRVVCDPDDARDVVQEAFVRVWRHAGRFKAGTKFTTWLYAIVTNLALDRVRAESRKRGLFTLLSRLPDNHVPAVRPEEGDDVAVSDLAARIKMLSGELPPRQRMVFVLRDLQDLPVAEVARVLRISESSVKTNLCYARQHIRRKIEELEKVR